MSSIKTSKIVPLSSSLIIDSTTTTVTNKLSAGGTAGNTPLAPLQVYGASTAHGADNRGTVLVSNETNSRQLQIGVNDSSGVAWLQGWIPSSAGLTLAIQPSGGNVGIGTTTPTVALDVTGQARTSVGTTGGSNAKTLTTKDYVDSLTRIGAVVVITASTQTDFPKIGGTFTSGIADPGLDTAGISGKPSTWTATISSGELSITADGGTWIGCSLHNNGAGASNIRYAYQTGTSTSVYSTSDRGVTVILVRIA
jgi:hypothetical protein